MQESTPVYAVVQAATVPLRASRPSKMTIVVGFVFLAAVGALGWTLFLKDLFDRRQKAGKDPTILE